PIQRRILVGGPRPGTDLPIRRRLHDLRRGPEGSQSPQAGDVLMIVLPVWARRGSEHVVTRQAMMEVALQRSLFVCGGGGVWSSVSTARRKTSVGSGLEGRLP